MAGRPHAMAGTASSAPPVSVMVSEVGAGSVVAVATIMAIAARRWPVDARLRWYEEHLASRLNRPDMIAYMLIACVIGLALGVGMIAYGVFLITTALD